MSFTEAETAELELLANALQLFIRQHNQTTEINELPLDEKSITGQRVKESSDLWYLGGWAIEGAPPRFKATWSIEITPGENTFVIVDLDRKENKYIVADWTVEDTF